MNVAASNKIPSMLFSLIKLFTRFKLIEACQRLGQRDSLYKGHPVELCVESVVRPVTSPKLSAKPAGDAS